MSELSCKTELSPDGRLIGDVRQAPLEESFLQRLLTEPFDEHHEKLIFGPFIRGGAYEPRAPAAPQGVRSAERDGPACSYVVPWRRMDCAEEARC